MENRTDQEAELRAAQAWRTETPGHDGWPRTVRPDDPNKFYVISADCHAVEPKDWMTGYIADDAREQLRTRRSRRDKEMDAERAEGVREPKVKPAGESGNKDSSVPSHLLDRSMMAGEDLERLLSGRYADQRMEDNARDGVDAEIIFPGAARLLGIPIPGWQLPYPRLTGQSNTSISIRTRRLPTTQPDVIAGKQHRP